jgi:protease-4
MLHPQQAAVMMPIVKGIIAGNLLEMDKDERKLSEKIELKDFYSGSKSKLSGTNRNKSVFVVHLEGTMTKEDTCFNYGTRTIADELRRADKESDVIGHIIVADSGGGAADSVPDLADAIRSLEKPIVSLVDGMAASACMYAISYTSRILAHQDTDMVGCIGTMITVSGWPKLRRDADGYVEMRIYADQSAEKNADYEAALEGDTRLIRENLLDPLCEKFINDMKANRPAAADDQLKGRTYFAKDVVGSLIDGIGGMADAIDAVLEMADSKNTKPNESNMKSKYPNMTALASLAEAVLAEDGSVTLQANQLEEIEAALSAQSQAAETQELENLRSQLSERDTTITGLQEQVANAETQHTTDAARIQELETALNAAINHEPDGDGIQVKKNPEAADEEGGAKPAENYEQAVSVCREFLNNH